MDTAFDYYSNYFFQWIINSRSLISQNPTRRTSPHAWTHTLWPWGEFSEGHIFSALQSECVCKWFGNPFATLLHAISSFSRWAEERVKKFIQIRRTGVPNQYKKSPWVTDDRQRLRNSPLVIIFFNSSYFHPGEDAEIHNTRRNLSTCSWMGYSSLLEINANAIASPKDLIDFMPITIILCLYCLSPFLCHSWFAKRKILSKFQSHPNLCSVSFHRQCALFFLLSVIVVHPVLQDRQSIIVPVFVAAKELQSKITIHRR